MGFLNQDHGDAFDRPLKRDDNALFALEWPSTSAGSGKLVQNNKRSGRSQGKGSFLRKAHCQLCGWPNDLNKIDHTGGSEDGDGAGGTITKTTVTATFVGGGAWSEISADQAPRKGSGCAMCFSKNSSKDKIENVDAMNPISTLGF